MKISDSLSISDQLVERPRLNELFNNDFMNMNVICVCAHSGWGKTTAVAQWIAGERYSRITVERANIGECFEAFQQEVTDRKRGQIIVIDNFQLFSDIQKNDVQKTILSSVGKFIVISRSPVEPLFAREIGRKVMVIGIKDLSFTKPEAEQFLLNENISEKSIKTIMEIPSAKSGWILGFIYHINVLKQHGGDYDEDCYKEGREAIFKYFDIEIMSQFSNCQQEFLLVIGGFEKISIAQMENLTGRKDIRAMVDNIMAKSSFLKELSSDIYTMHPFFGEYILRTRKKRMQPSELKRIYRKAGMEFTKEEDYHMALESYYQAGDKESIATIIEDFSRLGIAKSGIWKNKKYFYFLDEEQILESPLLCGFMAMLEMIAFHIEKSEWWENQLKIQLANTRSSENRYWEIKNQLNYLSVALVYKKYKNIFIKLRDISKSEMTQTLNQQQITITGNRPSVLDGGRDLSQYIRFSKWLYPTMDEIFIKLYGDSAVGAMSVFYAECLYQQNDYSQSIM